MLDQHKSNDENRFPYLSQGTFLHLGGGIAFTQEMSVMLSKIKLFADMQPEDLRLLSLYSDAYEMTNNSPLFQEGDVSGCLYLVLDGAVEIYKNCGQNQRRRVSTIRPGYSLGEMSIIDGHPYSATAVPRIGSVLLLITKAGMRRICHEYESLYGKILASMVKQMSGRLRQSTEVMANALLEKDRLYLQVDNLKAIKSQLGKATESKSQFLANMSHELRTPLNAILGYAEILKEDLEADDFDLERFIADLDKIHGSGGYLLSLINNILDLSKIEAGRMDLHIEYFDVQLIVTEVLASVVPLAHKNGNVINHHGASDLDFIRSDSIKLKQILLNLLSNACKFTSNGEITFRINQEILGAKRCYELSVEDSGVGLNDAQMAKLFQAFEQTSSDISGKYGGTGLGLMVSQKLANLLGGEIVVTSVLGKGSTFTLKIPVDMVPEEEDLPLCL